MKDGYTQRNHPVVIRYIIVVMTALAVMYFFIQVPDLTTTFLLAFFLSWLFFQPIAKIQTMGVSRVGTVAIMYGSVFFLLLILISIFLPQLTQEIRLAASQSGEYTQKLEEWLNTWQDLHVPDSIQQIVQKNMETIQDRFFALFDSFLSGLGNFWGKMLTWLIAPILSFYLLKDWPLWRDTFLNVFPPRFEEKFVSLV